MASGILPSTGHKLTESNSVQLSLHPESRKDTDRLFNALSAGGQVEMPMENTFGGANFGSFTDKYGIKWMIN